MIYLNQCCCFLLPVVIITVCPNLPWSTDHWPHKYALTLLWHGSDSFSLEIAKLSVHAFILSAIMSIPLLSLCLNFVFLKPLSVCLFLILQSVHQISWGALQIVWWPTKPMHKEEHLSRIWWSEGTLGSPAIPEQPDWRCSWSTWKCNWKMLTS